jgi:ABC-2 type transport system permease protein
MSAGLATSKGKKSGRHFDELLKVQGKLALREPFAVLGGIGIPLVLMIVFGFISQRVPGDVAGTGHSVLDLWMPTLMVISFITIAMSLPATMVRDREIGWLRRVSTTPLSPFRLLAVQLLFNLAFALAAIVILILGSKIFFGESLHVGIGFFLVSIILAAAEIFALGLVLVALAPSQIVGQSAAGVLFFVLMFLSGLWIQPEQAGDPLKTIMYYSPTGAATRALLNSVFNTAPAWTTILTMLVYTAVFGFIAVRYFRWE